MYIEVKIAWKFGEFLREPAMKVINFKKQKMNLVTKEQHEPYENEKICYICKEKFENRYLRNKKHHKLDIIVIIQENIEVLHIAYVI